ncbi:hypothetical protein CkaCkLH20_10171 [Colletotrichum karsti]|uniref:Uncharacterized protein n=1 Tax=Colletotrichum karsti TaxID=1095194 RepID=A0A9P6HXG3_9PEZI|nr:uncharacterized protein CkaCkLH20_10171 [Colletotrichum karsti]KAF9872344.1 hypothetical protein CkaCkLH20_10171 [Colletotrichum karsti]
MLNINLSNPIIHQRQSSPIITITVMAPLSQPQAETYPILVLGIAIAILGTLRWYSNLGRDYDPDHGLYDGQTLGGPQQRPRGPIPALYHMRYLDPVVEARIRCKREARRQRFITILMEGRREHLEEPHPPPPRAINLLFPHERLESVDGGSETTTRHMPSVSSGAQPEYGDPNLPDGEEQQEPMPARAGTPIPGGHEQQQLIPARVDTPVPERQEEQDPTPARADTPVPGEIEQPARADTPIPGGQELQESVPTPPYITIPESEYRDYRAQGEISPDSQLYLDTFLPWPFKIPPATSGASASQSGDEAGSENEENDEQLEEEADSDTVVPTDIDSLNEDAEVAVEDFNHANGDERTHGELNPEANDAKSDDSDYEDNGPRSHRLDRPQEDPPLPRLYFDCQAPQEEPPPPAQEPRPFSIANWLASLFDAGPDNAWLMPM